jgi:hypothetical protein
MERSGLAVTLAHLGPDRAGRHRIQTPVGNIVTACSCDRHRVTVGSDVIYHPDGLA